MTFTIPAADGPAMVLSAEGLRLIKSFEGYHRRLKDGTCVAYKCPAGVWTLGYGCTEGIKPGMQWTEQEAEEALARELAKFESAVRRLVKVPLNQNEFDALVSFAYNCGEGALGRSTLLKRLNKEDRVGAAKGFNAYIKGGGRVLKGLVARRAREAALFLKPTEAPSAPAMPQAIGKASPVVEALKALGTVRTIGTVAAGGTGATVAASNPEAVSEAVSVLPAVPETITQTIANGSAWQAIGDEAWKLVNWFAALPLWAQAPLVCSVALVAAWPHIWPARQPESD